LRWPSRGDQDGNDPRAPPGAGDAPSPRPGPAPDPAGLSELQIQSLAKAAGPTKSLKYGFTYSDLTQRFIPALVFDSFSDKPITYERAHEILEKTQPTPPFNNQAD
jgi:hypothetical protein